MQQVEYRPKQGIEHLTCHVVLKVNLSCATVWEDIKENVLVAQRAMERLSQLTLKASSVSAVSPPTSTAGGTLPCPSSLVGPSVSDVTMVTPVSSCLSALLLVFR